jgi:hypothetical protein
MQARYGPDPLSSVQRIPALWLSAKKIAKKDCSFSELSLVLLQINLNTLEVKRLWAQAVCLCLLFSSNRVRAELPILTFANTGSELAICPSQDSQGDCSCRRRGRPPLRDRYPVAVARLLGQLVKLHNDSRDSSDGSPPVTIDTEWIFNTWHSLVRKHNEEAAIIADPLVKGDRKDGRFSWSWVRSVGMELGMLCQKSGSKEDKPPEPEDCEKYEQEVRAVMAEKNIDPRAMFLFDEYNDFKYVPPPRVVTSRQERECVGPQANQKAHTPQKSGGRKSLTCGLGLTPTWTARALVLVDSCAAETQTMIQDVLGKHVVLCVNKTGNVHGATHVDLVYKKYLAGEFRNMKQALCLDESQPLFYGEDHAPGHYHDQCSITGRSGLCAERKEFLTSVNGWRKLTPKKGSERRICVLRRSVSLVRAGLGAARKSSILGSGRPRPAPKPVQQVGREAAHRLEEFWGRPRPPRPPKSTICGRPPDQP